MFLLLHWSFKYLYHHNFWNPEWDQYTMFCYNTLFWVLSVIYWSRQRCKSSHIVIAAHILPIYALRSTCINIIRSLGALGYLTGKHESADGNCRYYTASVSQRCYILIASYWLYLLPCFTSKSFLSHYEIILFLFVILHVRLLWRDFLSKLSIVHISSVI